MRTPLTASNAATCARRNRSGPMTALAARIRLPTGTGMPIDRSSGADGSIDGAAKARSHRQSSPMRTMVVPSGGANGPLASAKASPLCVTTSSPPRPSGTPLSAARRAGRTRTLRTDLRGDRIVELVLARRRRRQLRERAAEVDGLAVQQRRRDRAGQPPVGRRGDVGDEPDGAERGRQRQDRGGPPTDPHSTLVARRAWTRRG